MAWPTTNDPRTEFVTLRLTVGEMGDVDAAVASGPHKNRSAFVRSCVERCLAADARRAKRNQPSEATPGAGMFAEDDD
jgi:Arc/MetJ-type ribon-helix-helix transcriptional regulator